MSKLSKPSRAERLLIKSDAPPGKEEDGVVDADKMRTVIDKALSVADAPWPNTFFGFDAPPTQGPLCAYSQCTSTKDAPLLTKKCKGCHFVKYCSKACRDAASDMHIVSCGGMHNEVQEIDGKKVSVTEYHREVKGVEITKSNEAKAFVGTVVNDVRFTHILRYAQDQVLIAIQVAFDGGIIRGAFPTDMNDLACTDDESADEYSARLEKLALRRMTLSFMKHRMTGSESRTASDTMTRVGLTLEVPEETKLPGNTQDLIYTDFREIMLTPNCDLPWIGLHLFASICAFALGVKRSLHAVPQLVAMLLLYPMRTPRDQVQRSQFFALLEGHASPCVVAVPDRTITDDLEISQELSVPDRTLADQYRDDLNVNQAFSALYLFYLYPVSDPEQKSIAFVLWRTGNENTLFGALPNGMQKVRHWLTVNEHADFESMSCDTVLDRFLPDLHDLTRDEATVATREAALRRCFSMPESHFIREALTSAAELPVYSITCCRAFLM